MRIGGALECFPGQSKLAPPALGALLAAAGRGPVGIHAGTGVALQGSLARADPHRPLRAWCPTAHRTRPHGAIQGQFRTARVALDQLRAEGLEVSYQGRGVFVREHAPRRRLTTDMTQRGPGGQRGWYATLARGGLEPASRTTVYQTPCPPQAAEWLGIQEGTEVVVRDRVMGIQGQPPDQPATSYLPLGVAERVPQVRDPNRGGLLNWLEDAYGSLSFRDVLSCRMPDQRERDLLDLPLGTPVLILDGATYAGDGQALQYIAKVITSDRLETAYVYGAQPPPID